MGILIWLLVGLIAGALARFLVPGEDPIGFVGTMVLGLIGSLIGGFLGNVISDGEFDVSSAGLVGSVVGAAIALLIYRTLRNRSTLSGLQYASSYPTCGPGGRGLALCPHPSQTPDLRRNDMTESLTRELPNQAGSASIARQFLREHAILDSMRQTEADLLVTELVANVIQHAPQAETITLTLDQDRATGLKVTVSHRAHGDIDGAGQGIGHLVTERYSKRWGTTFEDGVLHVWFVLRTPGSVSLSPELTDHDLFDRMTEDPASFSGELLNRHSALALAISRRYRGKGIDDDDLQQVAQMALLKAIHRFDDSYGDLRPFAAVTISGELKKLLRDRGWSVRVPRALQESSLNLGRATEKLTQELNRIPTDEELARELDIAPEEVGEARSAGRAYRSSSIEKPAESTGLSLLDRLEDPDPGLFNAEERVMISEAIQELPVRQQQILKLRFDEDLTQTEIGELLDISQMHVSRLLSRAIEELRVRLGESE